MTGMPQEAMGRDELQSPTSSARLYKPSLERGASWTQAFLSFLLSRTWTQWISSEVNGAPDNGKKHPRVSAL